MEIKAKRYKIISFTSVALFFFCLTGLFITANRNISLHNQLDDSKLTTELHLSEKLALEKKINHMNKQVISLQKENGLISNNLLEKNTKLDEKNKELQNLRQDYSNSGSFKNEIRNLKIQKEKLESLNAELTAALARTNLDNESLNELIISLKEHNNRLTENNRLLTAMSANNYRIDATRGKKNKITSFAARTKKITLGFDVPENVVEKIRFTIITPEGKSISNENDGLSWSVCNNGQLMASLTLSTGDIQVTKRIEMCYKPDSKLTPGIYKIDIYNNESYMGSCQVKLR